MLKHIPRERYVGQVPTPFAFYRPANIFGGGNVVPSTFGVAMLDGAPVEITPEQLAAHPAVQALMQSSAEAAIRAVNTPNPTDRPGGSVNVNLGRPQRISVAKAICAMRDGNWAGSELERDFSQATRAIYGGKDADPAAFAYPRTFAAFADVVDQAAIRVESADKLKEWAVRAAGEGSTGAGGALVPAQYMQDQFVLSLQTAVAFRNAPGVDTIPVQSPLVYFPRETVMPTSAAYAEAATITASDPTFGQQAITIKKQAALNQFSNELLADSTPAYEQYIGRSLARSLALTQDLQYLEGVGTGANVLGLGSYTGLTASPAAATNGDYWGQNAATTPTAPGTDFPLAMISAARVAGWEPNAWIMRPDVWQSLQKVKDVNGRYILESSGGVFGAPVVVPNIGALPTQNTYVSPPWKGVLFGIPVFLTAQIPTAETQGDRSDATHVYLGDFNFARVLERQAIELAISDQILFTTDQTAVRVSGRSAIVLTIPGAFMKQSGVAATPHA